MSENETVKVERVYVTNPNYEQYYNKKQKEIEKKQAERKEALRESTRLRTPSGRIRPLLQSEIEEAQKNAQSAKHCARILGVSYPTYKKYAKMYGVFENLMNPAGKGITKHGAGNGAPGRRTALDRILDGEKTGTPNWRLKKMLLSSGYMPKCCANCGYEEERVFDGKVPLLMDFVDGNKKNHKWDNIRMLCYNCWFQINGDLFGRAMRNVKRDVWDFQYIHK
jgi:hypothetical protein